MQKKILFLYCFLFCTFAFCADQQQKELASKRRLFQEADEHYNQGLLWQQRNELKTAAYCFTQAGIKSKDHLLGATVHLAYYHTLKRTDCVIADAIIKAAKAFFEKAANAQSAAEKHPLYWPEIQKCFELPEVVPTKNGSTKKRRSAEKGKEAKDEQASQTLPKKIKTAEDYYKEGMVFQSKGDIPEAAKCLIRTMEMSSNTYGLRAGVPLAFYFCQNKDGGVITHCQMRWIKSHLQKPNYAERAAKQFPYYWPSIKRYFDVYDKNRVKRAPDEGTSAELEENAERRLKRKCTQADEDV
ncbi:MAG: hypothetical protein WD055_00685 [Candidatus Dependentiae bacterium]